MDHKRVIDYFREAGYGEFVDLLLTDDACYDHQGRIVYGHVTWKLGCDVIGLKAMFQQCLKLMSECI